MSVEATRRLIAAVVAAFFTLSAAAEPPELRLMTYNIRLDHASDGVNAWPNRKDWVAAQVQWLRPDILGMQVVLSAQRADLVAGLPGYRWLGEGRDPEGKGEATPIAFLENRFELIDSGTFWLSPTPEVSSRAWDAAFPRIVTWARLRALPSGDVVLALNTHWDHVGVIARRQSAVQIQRWLKENARRCERILLFGDFNSTLETEQLQTLTAGQSLRDARARSMSPPFGPEGTFNGFKPVPDAKAIDHVLTGPGVTVRRHAVFVQVIDGRVPSDHFPVLVDFTPGPCGPGD